MRWCKLNKTAYIFIDQKTRFSLGKGEVKPLPAQMGEQTRLVVAVRWNSNLRASSRQPFLAQTLSPQNRRKSLRHLKRKVLKIGSQS